MITTTEQIYEFVEQLQHGAREHGYDDIAERLDDAMHLGSSGLEILGAIRSVLQDEKQRLQKITENQKIEGAIAFVDKSFGRT